MASVHEHDPHRDRPTKASGLTARDEMGAPTRDRHTHGRPSGSGDVSTGTHRRRVGVIVVDMLLVVLFCGAIVGGFFGYRAFRNAYAPKEEMRETVLLVELSCLDVEAVPDYWNADAPMYVSDEVGAEPIAYLSDVPYIKTLPPDPEHPDAPLQKTVHLLLHTTAEYREGEGYFVGDTALYAGMVYDVRVDGVSTSAMILSVMPAEESTPSAGA